MLVIDCIIFVNLTPYIILVYDWFLVCSALLTSLYTEANEPPLYYRRLNVNMDYSIRRSANSSNPAYNCGFNTSLTEYV